MRKAAETALWMLGGLVGLLALCRSISYGVRLSSPVPFGDQWDFVATMPRLFGQGIRYAELVAQTNEHRIATSRLLFLIDLRYFDYTSYFTIFCSYVVLMAGGAALAALSARSRRDFVAKACLFSGMLLSICQWENLSWGFQTQFPLVHVFALASLTALGLALRGGGRIRVALALVAACGSDVLTIFSLASGLLLIVPALVVAGFSRRLLRWEFAVYALGHLFGCLLFFQGYVFATAAAHPTGLSDLLLFFLDFLGSPLQAIPSGATIGGIGVVALFGAALAVSARRLSARHKVPLAATVALGLITFVLLEAAATAHGRAAGGVQFATSSRYTLPALFGMAALVLFWSHRIWPPWVRTTAAIAAMIVLVAANLSDPFLRDWRARSLTLQRAGYDLMAAHPPDRDLQEIHPVADIVRQGAAFLKAHRLGPFSVRWAEGLRPPIEAIDPHRPGALPACAIAIDEARTSAGDHNVEVTGWISDAEQPIGDGFILAYDAQDRLLGFTRQLIEREDVAQTFGLVAGRFGFRIQLDGASSADLAASPVRFILVPLSPGQTACVSARTIDPQPE